MNEYCPLAQFYIRNTNLLRIKGRGGSTTVRPSYLWLIGRPDLPESYSSWTYLSGQLLKKESVCGGGGGSTFEIIKIWPKVGGHADMWLVSKS